MKENGKTNGKQLIVTFILSMIAMLTNYIISLCLTPYISTSLGTEAYGFVSMAKTISNYGVIVTSCLNSYISRFVTIKYHENKINDAIRYYSSAFYANIFFVIIAIAFDVFFVWNIELFFVVPSTLLSDVRILFFIEIISYMLYSLCSVMGTYAYVKDKLSHISTINIIYYFCEAVLLLALFHFLPAHIYYVPIALLCSAIVSLVMYSVLARKNAPELTLNVKYFSFSAVKDLFVSGIWNSINSIGNLLNSGLDLWISNLMLSPTSMGELSIVKTVSTIFTSIAQIISRPFQPLLLQCYSGKDTERVVSIFNIQIKISGYFVAILTAGFFSIGLSYFHLWTPNENTVLLNRLAIITVLGFVFEGMATPLFYTYTLTLKNRVPCVLTIISGIVNVTSMFFLLSNTSLGLYAVVGTTSVLAFLMYFVFTPIYAAYCIGTKLNAYYSSILKVLLSTVITVVICYFLPFSDILNTWTGFIVSAFIIALIGISVMWICSFSTDDRRFIIESIKNRCNKRVK